MKAIMESFHPFLQRFEVEFNDVMVSADDGVELFTRVLTPGENFKGPVIVIRSPYMTYSPQPEQEYAEFIRAGYAVVYQHCRGCGQSKGNSVPYLNEREDGLALLEWIRKQPFYDDEIYLFGTSYTASVHFAYLNTAGDDVKGAILSVQDCKRYNIIYRNGFLKCGLHGSWAVSMYDKNQNKKRAFSCNTFRTMPLKNISKIVFGTENTLFGEELKHPDPDDDFWKTPDGGIEYKTALDNLKIPVLFVGSFYDIYTEGMFDMWDNLSPELRSKSAFIVTPYDHNYYGSTDSPVLFKNGNLAEIWTNYPVEWFNSLRKKRTPSFITQGCITWHAQHENIWRTAPFLNNGEKSLQWILNDHTLDEVPAAENAITYTYNPYDPAEFNGGCCNNFGGQQLQDPPDSRYDIISFITPPLSRDMVFQGRGKVILKVASNCEDTCFYARLSYIDKAGKCYCMRDDIISLRSQHPDYVPDTAVEVELNFAPNAFKLSAGEKLRLDISSSCWKYFIPHRNKTGNYWEMETAAIAENTIYTGSSKLQLFERISE